MAILTLKELLSPFELLDIGSLYDRYSSGIDFTIVFLLFLGVAKVTLGGRFEGRGGRLIIIAVALALSVGFSVMERGVSFSLRSFGPLGAFFLIFLVSIVSFNLFRTTGIGSASSVCLAYIIVYLSLRLISPAFFGWIAQTGPWINGTLGLAFIASSIKLVLSLFRSRRSVESLPAELGGASYLGKEVEHEIEEEDIEKNLVKGKMRKLTRKDLKRSEDIIGYLKHIIEVTDGYGNSPEGRERISEELKKMGEGEHYILGKLDYLEKLNARLEKHDATRLKDLEQKYRAASGREKRLLKEERDREYRKLKLEEDMRNLKGKIVSLTQGLNNSVNAAMNCLQRGAYPHDVTRHLNEAIEYELAINGLFKDMNKLEDLLTALLDQGKNVLRKTAR